VFPMFRLALSSSGSASKLIIIYSRWSEPCPLCAFCRRSDKSVGPLSSDSLLPLFIVAIVVAQPLHLHACLAYVRTFHKHADWAGQTGFQVPNVAHPCSNVVCCTLHAHPHLYESYPDSAVLALWSSSHYCSLRHLHTPML